MSTKRRRSNAGLAATLLMAALLAGVAALGCSGNRSVSVGGSIHRGSGGNWGHSLSVGIHSHGRRR